MLPDLPAFAWIFGAVFWTLLAVRRARRSRGLSGPLDGPADDGRTPFPLFRSRGF